MLKIKNITKTFNPTGNIEDLKVALDDISLEIEKGDFVTIIGGNGSGKSTFVNIVSGVFFPDAGSIIIDGQDVTKLPEHKRSYFIGKVAQDPYQGTAADMSILENMSIAKRRNKRKTLWWGFNKRDTETFKIKLSELGLGLEDRLTSKIGVLSGGQRQAITLLMATLEKPSVLFLDEHTAALDPKTAKTVLEITDKVVTENRITTVMITHNMRDAITYGNRLIMFKHGKIVFDISGEDKKNLTIEQLLEKFENKDDLADTNLF